VSSDESPELRLDLPAAHSASRMARQVVGKFALEHGLGEAEIGTLELVTSELLSNAVDHGGGGAALEEKDLTADIRMQLSLTVIAGAWTLSVSDQGGGDPAELEPFLDSHSLPDLEDERGRGFFLLVQMVDELTVTRSADGKGLCFTARKQNGDSHP
jgi:anti-sigma regulatory factor (Ser/Thr protein kinase)